MSDKLLIDRKLLERLQERLDPHLDARGWGMVCDAFRAQLPSQGGEAVAGTLHISHFRDNPAMENVDFQLIAVLKPGSYRLYTHPADQVAEGVPENMRSLLQQIADNKDASYFIGDLQDQLRALLAKSEGVRK